jgi:hypothetical protein
VSDVPTHTASVAAFYKALIENGVEAQVAGVCTIEFNKALLSRATPPIELDPTERRAEIRAAADRKQSERREQLGMEA